MKCQRCNLEEQDEIQEDATSLEEKIEALNELTTKTVGDETYTLCEDCRIDQTGK